MPKNSPLSRFVLRRVRRERKAVGRTDSKQWRRLQSGLNSDTRHPASLLGSTERLEQVQVEGKEEVKGRRGEEDVDSIIRKILEQQTHLRSHLDRLERTRRGGDREGGRKEVKVEREGGKVVVPEVEEEVSERVGGQGGKEKGCSYLMKTFLNSTVESSEDFCRFGDFRHMCSFKSFRRETIFLQPRQWNRQCLGGQIRVEHCSKHRGIPFLLHLSL